LLPFPARKSGHDDVLELDDADLVLVEPSPLTPEALQSIRKSIADLSFREDGIEVVFEPVDPLDLEDAVAIPTPPPPESVIVPVSRSRQPSSPRLVWDADAENDVADECLASIAAETEKVRLSDPFILSSVSSVPPPPRPERERKDVVSLLRPAPVAHALAPVKIPKPNPPPRSPSASALWARNSNTTETRPSLPSLFARKTPDAASAPSSVATSSVFPSVPPVAFPSDAPRAEKNEPTVILLRERPRGAWVFGSAAIGALCAVTAMHFLGQWATPPAPPPPTVVTMAAAPPATAITPPVAVEATPAPAAEPKQEAKPIPTVKLTPPVVRFNDDQGVSIAKPKAKPVAAPAKAPLVPDSATAAKVDPAPPPPPPPKPKKPLTPEQELSEAQLKAALMK
jgi:hypothetical protein